jgi:hypothetical protein
MDFDGRIYPWQKRGTEKFSPFSKLGFLKFAHCVPALTFAAEKALVFRTLVAGHCSYYKPQSRTTIWQMLERSNR